MADFLIHPSQGQSSLDQSWAVSSSRLIALMQLPRFWITRAGQRRELLELDERQMRDCGFDPVMVRREALKPFWRD